MNDLALQSRIREIGIPVRAVNRAALFPGQNAQGRARLYATMSQQADSFLVLQIDPETGELQQFHADEQDSNYTTAVYQAHDGKLYIGAAHSGRLYCFDPDSEELQNLGVINAGSAIFPCRIDEDSRGVLWISSYKTADLTSYDPRTQRFTHYGRLDAVDMYAYCFVNTDDTIACLILQTEPHVVVFDPVSKEKQIVGPKIPKNEGTLNLYRGEDHQLYIDSSQGLFRIEGTKAVPEAVLPPPEKTKSELPDGRSFRFADAKAQTCQLLEIKHPDGRIETHSLDFEAAGTDIFSLHAGPDGCVYGSSVLPEHLFVYNPETEQLQDLGICSEATGEAYSFANWEGRLYISSYPGARLSVYDPARPYHFGTEPGANPRDLGRIDEVSYRPRSTLAGPAGKLWLASIPDYGLWGGPLSAYDPRTGAKQAFYRIAGDASCYTLAYLPNQELIAIGTHIAGGSGTQPKVDQAGMLLFDYTAETVIWEGTLDQPIRVFNALATGPDGYLYGTALGDKAAFLFAFDPKTKCFIHHCPAPAGGPCDNGLQLGPDGHLYGLTRRCIYRMHLDSYQVEILLELPSPLEGHAACGPLLHNQLYFSSGHRLLAARLEI